MISQSWSWILTITGVLGLLVASRWPKFGWMIGIAVQPLWLLYGGMTRQWGFIASGLSYGLAYILLLRREVRGTRWENISTAGFSSEELREERT